MKAGIFLLGVFLVQVSSVFAQTGKSAPATTQREMIIIDRNDGGNTSIEINEDGVFLNGEKIATRAELGNKDIRKKIIVQGSKSAQRRDVYDHYFESGRIERGQRALLGVFTDNSKKTEGAYIIRVSPNSAAETAGLREGDVITQIDGLSIEDAGDLTSTIRQYKPGERITIHFERNGKQRQTTAVLGTTQESPREVFEFSIPDVPPIPPVHDFSFGDGFHDNRKPRLGVSLEETRDGVRIRAVRPNSPAFEAGLKRGDIITYINNKHISSIDEIQRMVTETKSGDRLKIEVNRDDARVTLTVTFRDRNKIKDL